MVWNLIWLPGAAGCFFAIFWDRAELLLPTLSSTASTSLLHVGFPNLSTYVSKVWLYEAGE